MVGEERRAWVAVRRECATEWRERLPVRAAAIDTNGNATTASRNVRIRRRDAPRIRFALMPLAHSARQPGQRAPRRAKEDSARGQTEMETKRRAACRERQFMILWRECAAGALSACRRYDTKSNESVRMRSKFAPL